jgi:peroxiredoxin
MAVTPSTMLPLGTPAPDFALVDTASGSTVTRATFAGRPLLVVFMCNHCPFVIHLRTHLAAATRAWMGQGLAVVGISSNDPVAYPADAPERMREEAAAHGHAFPYLFDADQSVATAYHAACTPDFFLFDCDHRLAYRGRYDETRPTRHGVAGSPPTGADLGAAVAAVLSGQPVPAEQKPAMGCNIKWTPGREPAWFR